MRNPEHIEKIIKKLNVIWQKHPDLRFCQLISNVTVPTYGNNDIFYLEDDVFESALDNYLEEVLKQNVQRPKFKV